MTVLWPAKAFLEVFKKEPSLNQLQFTPHGPFGGGLYVASAATLGHRSLHVPRTPPTQT